MTTPIDELAGLRAAARTLAGEAARTVAEPRRFHENEGHRQQALGRAVAAVRLALRKDRAARSTSVPASNVSEGLRELPDKIDSFCSACGGDRWFVTADPDESGGPGEPYQVECLDSLHACAEQVRAALAHATSERLDVGLRKALELLDTMVERQTLTGATTARWLVRAALAHATPDRLDVDKLAEALFWTFNGDPTTAYDSQSDHDERVWHDHARTVLAYLAALSQPDATEEAGR